MVTFDEFKSEISFIRNTVFVKEHKIPIELEWDTLDKTAYHYVVNSEQHNIIAYARLLTNGKLGRFAVLKRWRQQGIGHMLLSDICENASKLDIDTLHLSSQLPAIDFYLKSGFQITGDIFLEAGIEHRAMHKTLK